MQLRHHTVNLSGDRCTLRPMTEDDWPLLVKWNNDPDVLYYADGNEVSGYALEDVQGMYRQISQSAYCFMSERMGQAIGECWLQAMNLERINSQYPTQDCRRIDLMIGEKEYWGQGIGTEVIGLLVEFAFTQEQADALFGCDIADYNPRSLRAFRRNGFQVENSIPQPPGNKAHICYDLQLAKVDFLSTVGNE